MLWLRRRRCQPELMDQPDLCPRRHATALRGLARLNLFGSARTLWPPLAALASRHRDRPLRVLDVATGGGDVPLRIWRRARRAGVSLQIEGCDRSPFAIEQASRAATKAGADIRFFVHDALNGKPLRGYDAVISSLFLHHLNEDEAVAVLRIMSATARLVLVNDLERTAANFAMVYAASRLVTRSPVVHVDALLSVEAAFTLDEVRALARRAGLAGATVERRRPCRFLLAQEQP
jgi:2-polyprenyl-3-methyl-5-hydroxy-6-metoxy-1,4-benzoquinol methylase